MRNFYFLLFAALHTGFCVGQELVSSSLGGEGDPLARHENALVTVGNKLILIGGRGEKPVDIYDLAERNWSKGAQPPFEIHHMQAVTLNGLVYVLGGFTGPWPYETPLSHVLIYDITENSWAIGNEIPEDRRRGAAGVVVNNEKIYLINGIINGHTSGWVNWLDEFDPYSNTWKKLPNSPVARDHFQAAVINEKLYVAGGRRSGSAENGFAGTVKETNVYDFKSEKWEVLPDIPTPRAGTSAAVFDDKYIVIGGESDTQEASHNEIEALNPGTKTWQTFTPLKTGRHGTQAISLENHIITGAGSGNRGGGPELTSFEVLSKNENPEINLEALKKAEITVSTNEVKFNGSPNSKKIELINSAENKAIVISYLQLDNPQEFEVILPQDFPLIIGPGKKINVEIKPKGPGNSPATLFIKALGKAAPLEIEISK